MQNIIISPIFNQFMSGRIWMGLDFQKITEDLENYGYILKIIAFRQLVDRLHEVPNNATIFYSTTYNESYLRYIVDTIDLISIMRPDINLIPNQHQLKALNNKGYQEYYKKTLGITKVEGKYYGDIDDLMCDVNNIQYPFVLKELKGALSSGVQLIRNKSELNKIKNRLKKKNFKEILAQKLNKRNSFKKDFDLNPNKALLEDNFKAVFQKRIPVVYQEFIPNLKFDFKVLQFGNKYYGLKRFSNKNDFRASGSGKFAFEDIPKDVLNYAEEITTKLKTPFVSLDIGIDNDNNCHLFEFQGTGFGPLTLTKSKFYYIYQGEAWKKIKASSNLEEEYANAIDYYIKNLHENS